MKKSLAIVLGVYALIILGALVYFVLLQKFGLQGLLFTIGGKDSVINVLDALILIVTVAALFLFAVSLLAFRRTRDARILIISMAFFFFAVKEFLFLFENFFPGEFIYIDNAERALEFLILVSFIMLMYGTYRRTGKKPLRRK